MLNARPWVTGLHVARRAHLLPNIGIRGLHRNAQYTRPNPNALPAVKQPTVTAEDGTKTLRLRQNGERALPLPPLMDPIALEAKERYKEPKALAMEEDKTEFQKALGTNPFAQALATPIRQCNVTRARLPSHFLQPFSTVFEYVETDNKISSSGTTEQDGKLTPRLVPGVASSFRRGDKVSAAGSSSYILNRREMLDHVNKKQRWVGMATLRMQEAYGRKAGKKNVRVSKEWSWDTKTPDVVLGKHRDNALRHLGECRQEGLVLLQEQSEVLMDREVSCVLVLDAEADSELPSVGSARQRFNLTALFGAERWPSLREDIAESWREESCLLVLKDARTVKLQLALLKLHAYLALPT